MKEAKLNLVLPPDYRNTSSQSRMWKLAPSSPLNFDSLFLSLSLSLPPSSLLFPFLSFLLSLTLRRSFENLFTLHNVNRVNHTNQHLSKSLSAMFVCNLSGWAPLSKASPATASKGHQRHPHHKPQPVLQVIDTIYMAEEVA